MLRTHAGQINDLIELLENIKGDNLTLVEVGSYMGESMEIFAKSGRFKKIYCVDQPIFNLYFIDRVNYIKNKKISFWKESTNSTIAQHHCRWEAPWSNNFISHRLGKSYLENYKDNLKGFYVSTGNI